MKVKIKKHAMRMDEVSFSNAKFSDGVINILLETRISKFSVNYSCLESSCNVLPLLFGGNFSNL